MSVIRCAKDTTTAFLLDPDDGLRKLNALSGLSTSIGSAATPIAFPRVGAAVPSCARQSGEIDLVSTGVFGEMSMEW
jgi:hypothetical protein